MSKRRPAKPQQKFPVPVWLIAAVAVIVVIVGGVLILGGGDDEKSDSSDGVALAAEISVDEAVTMRDQGAFMLDVRQQNEWDEYHMPNSVLIPLDQLAGRLSELPKDQDIVVVCRSGNRSAQARDLLLESGFTQVTSMAGGLSEWRDKGYPVE